MCFRLSISIFSAKFHKCKYCRLVFKRPHNVTLHIRQKEICPICKILISNIPNMRVRFKRHHGNQRFTNRTKSKLKWIQVRKSDLMNGRFNRSCDSEDESTSPSTSSLMHHLILHKYDSGTIHSKAAQQPATIAME